MVAKGYALIKYNFMTYHFKKCEPNEYIYRIEFLNTVASHDDSQDYIKFSEKLGIEHIDSYFRWVYFRKKSEDGPVKIHTAIESKIKHYKSIMTFQGFISLSNLPIAFANISIGNVTTTIYRSSKFIFSHSSWHILF